MKKLFVILMVALIGIGSVFAEENTLLDTSVSAELNGYDYISNFEVDSDSGRFQKSKDLFIFNNAEGIVVRATNVPQYSTSTYKIVPAYSSFLNEPNSGAGYLDNAAAIKSISVTYRTNRSYDEIFLQYSVTPTGPIKEVKMPQDFNSTQSMVFQTSVYNAGDYISDVNKRDVKSYPIIGSPANGIYFRGIRIQTNIPTGYMAYGSESIVQIKEVKVIYDNAKTSEQLEAEKAYKDLFGIDEQSELRDKETRKLDERNRLRANEAALMHKDESETTDAK